jgi:hypothetical protein
MEAELTLLGGDGFGSKGATPLRSYDHVPLGAAGYYLLGQVCQRTNRKADAIAHFKQCLALDSCHWSAFEALCRLGEVVPVPCLSETWLASPERVQSHNAVNVHSFSAMNANDTSTTSDTRTPFQPTMLARLASPSGTTDTTVGTAPALGARTVPNTLHLASTGPRHTIGHMASKLFDSATRQRDGGSPSADDSMDGVAVKSADAAPASTTFLSTASTLLRPTAMRKHVRCVELQDLSTPPVAYRFVMIGV